MEKKTNKAKLEIFKSHIALDENPSTEIQYG